LILFSIKEKDFIFKMSNRMYCKSSQSCNSERLLLHF